MNRPLIVGIAGGIIVLVAIALTFFIDREPDRAVQQGPASSGAPPSSSQSSPATGSGQPGGAGEAGIPSKGAGTPAAGQGASGATETAGAPDKPTFDIVRVNPQGDTVIAGRAQPDSEITVLRGDEVIGRAKADKRGEWVLVPQTPIAPGTHTLTIVSRGADGTEVSSDQSVVVVVPERGKDIAGGPSTGNTGSLALSVPRDGTGAPVVLQTPGGIGNSQLSFDAIDYGQSGGDLGLSGRAPPGAEVRVYLDNRFVGRATADEKGIWRLNPGIDIAEGLYKMRVDRVDTAGKVIARVELPFSRAKPLSGLADGTVVFVQPGNSLWRLARRSYGEGVRYTEIYEANKDQIRNPDLIYPGQVFVLPKVN